MPFSCLIIYAVDITNGLISPSCVLQSIIMHSHSRCKVSLGREGCRAPVPYLLRILHGSFVKDVLKGGRALPATVHQSRRRGGQHLPHGEMVQVHVEISRNLSVVFYVKQRQSDKERLDLNNNKKQSRPSLRLKLPGKENMLSKKKPIYDCCYKLLLKRKESPSLPFVTNILFLRLTNLPHPDLKAARL